MRLSRTSDFSAVTYLLRPEAERISIKRQHDPRIGKSRQRRRYLPESKLRAGARRIVVYRLVTKPLRLRKGFCQRPELLDLRR